MQVIQRHLTTGERAMLSLLLTALLTGGYTGIDAISSSGNIDWHTVIVVAIVTALGTFGHTLATYLTTHGNTPLGAEIEAATDAVEKRFPPATAPTPAAKQQFAPIPPTQPINPIILPPEPLKGTIQTQAIIPQPPTPPQN